MKKKEYAINKFTRYAKEDYGVVKYDKGLLIVSKIPKAKVECVFGAYNGQVISKPLNIEGLPNNIVKGFEQIIEDQKEQYEKFNLASAPKLETISKELKDDIAKYGKTKFVNQYAGYTKAMLARALEVAFQEKIDLIGTVKVGVVNVEGKIRYGEFDLTKSEMFKRLADKGLASEQTVSMNELKKQIDMDQTKAWLCLLTAWCDIKRGKIFASRKVIDMVHNNIRGKEFEEALELFEFDNIAKGAVGKVDRIEKTDIVYYEIVAFFDVLLSAYSKGVIKTKYVLNEGLTIEDLEKVLTTDDEVPKEDILNIISGKYPIITSETIAQLTGNDDKDFLYKTKGALKKLSQTVWLIEGKMGNRRVLYIMPPILWSAVAVGRGVLYICEVRKELLDYKIEKHKRTFAILDGGAFARISKSQVAPKTIKDAKELLIVLIKQAGSRSDHKTYIPYDFFHDMANERKTRSKERVIRGLEALKEVGNIEGYKDYKGKFMVNIGG